MGVVMGGACPSVGAEDEVVVCPGGCGFNCVRDGVKVATSSTCCAWSCCLLCSL